MHLLQVAHNYKERGMHVFLMKPAIDTRDGNKIHSRLGVEADCSMISTTDDVFDQVYRMHDVKKIDCVLVDESQFLTQDQVEQLARVVDLLEIPVMCYGLTVDFQAKLFPGSKALIELADKKHELKTICHCGSKATLVLRLVNGKPTFTGEQIQIGGNDSYVSVCRKHYYAGKFE